MVSSHPRSGTGHRGASLACEDSPAHRGASAAPSDATLGCRASTSVLRLAALLAQGIGAWPLVSTVPPFPPNRFGEWCWTESAIGTAMLSYFTVPNSTREYKPSPMPNWLSGEVFPSGTVAKVTFRFAYRGPSMNFASDNAAGIAPEIL